MGIHNVANAAAKELFEDLKKEVLKFDPVAFCEQYLKVDGQARLQINGSGWKFLADIYRYIALHAIQKDGKPVVIVKGRQVGATTLASALEMYFMTSGLFGSSEKYPPIRLLHCFPSLQNVSNFSKTKLAPMMRSSMDNYVLRQGLGWDEKLGKRKSDAPDDTLHSKLFKNENMLLIDSNGNNAARLQGLTLDGIFHDEVQRMLETDINNDVKTLTAAKYGPVSQGIQAYFGTPLNKGSYFWKIWEASDQRYYHLGCTSCNEYFMLYEPDSDKWEEIWLHGNIIKCPHCGFELEKSVAVDNGKWVSSREHLENGSDPIYVGFHFNQLLLPYITKEVIQRENPKYNPTKSVPVWKTDVLGEFYSGSALPMTEEELYKYCKDQNNIVSTRSIENGRTYFMGADWGGKDASDPGGGGKSYSCVVIISVGVDGIVHIENAFKLKQNDLDYKKSIISEMFSRFNIKMTVADIGHGHDTVKEIQKEYQSRFWSCTNSGTLLRPLKADAEILNITCNKDMMLDDVFTMMRRSKVLFPMGNSRSYEQLNWLVQDCCSMELEKKTVSGNVLNKYVKGNSPNDGLMALMYAIIAHRFTITRGFKVKDHKVGKKAGNAPVLAYLPRI